MEVTGHSDVRRAVQLQKADLAATVRVGACTTGNDWTRCLAGLDLANAMASAHTD